VAKRDRYELGLRNLIAAGIRTGEFVSGDAALAARAMLGALNWSVQWFSPEGPLSSAEIAEGLAGYLIRGLLAKPDSLQRFAAESTAPQGVQNYFPKDARKHVAAG
jgi:hypothetical protein